jgi:hypothetical protein
MRLLLLLTTLHLPLTAAAADCPARVPVPTLRDALGSAEAAFSVQDGAKVTQAVAMARASLPCLDAPLTPDDAAHLHRVEALADFLSRDVEGTVLHYRAVLRLKPDYTLPAGIAPEGGPLRQLFERATQAGAPLLRDVPAPAEGAVLIDGAQVPNAPSNLPFILQRLNAGGAVQTTMLLDPGAELPQYETRRDVELASRLPPPTPPEPPSPGGESARRGGTARRIALFSAGGVALVGSGICLAQAGSEKSAYEDLSVTAPADDAWLTRARSLDDHITRNQGFLRGAAVLGAVGLGLTVGGVF